MRTIIFDLTINPNFLVNQKARFYELLTIRMYLHGLRDAKKINLGDAVELKKVPLKARKDVADIVSHSGFIPVLNGHPIKTTIINEIAEEGELLQNAQKMWERRKKKSGKLKRCSCKKK